MARVGEMQGVPAQIVKLKSDGQRRHPSYCQFAKGKGKKRICKAKKCPMYNLHCSSAAKCDFYLVKP